MRFEADFQDTFHTLAAPKAARDHFGDLDAIVANYGDLDKADKVDDRTLRYLQKAANNGVVTFQGRYACRYEYVGDDTLRWTTLPDDRNMASNGVARFVADKDGTRIEYQAQIELDMDVNRMIGAMLGPVIRELVKQETKGYVQRMIKSLEAKT